MEEEGAGRLLGREGVLSRAFVGNPGGGLAGTTEAGVGGSSEGDTETGSDIALDGGVWLLPFVREFEGNAVENCFGLRAVKSVAGYNEGGEVTSLVLAFLKVLPLLFSLMSFQGRDWFSVALGFGVEVRNSNVQDTIGGAIEEVPHQEIATFLSGVVDGVVGVRRFLSTNPGLPAAGRRANGLTVQFSEIISHGIVAGVNKTAILTFHRVVY